MIVTVWTKSNCVQCDQTKKQFDKLGVRFVEKDLETDLEALEAFRVQGLLSAPIVETDVKVWAGFRLDKIRSLAGFLRSQEVKG